MKTRLAACEKGKRNPARAGQDEIQSLRLWTKSLRDQPSQSCDCYGLASDIRSCRADWGAGLLLPVTAFDSLVEGSGVGIAEVHILAYGVLLAGGGDIFYGFQE